ncbi:MAG: hypothetical protein NTW19_16830 [Planctomycetota bacterium]|nr:hypothetical protein [Planctomycetota bacterium]
MPRILRAIAACLAALLLEACSSAAPRPAWTDLSHNTDIDREVQVDTPFVRLYDVRDLYVHAPNPSAAFEKLLLDIAAVKPAPLIVTYDSGKLAVKASAACHAGVIKLIADRRQAIRDAKAKASEPPAPAAPAVPDADEP